MDLLSSGIICVTYLAYLFPKITWHIFSSFLSSVLILYCSGFQVSYFYNFIQCLLVYILDFLSTVYSILFLTCVIKSQSILSFPGFLTSPFVQKLISIFFCALNTSQILSLLYSRRRGGILKMFSDL